jgi:uncharacterized protein (TIGR02217 family)
MSNEIYPALPGLSIEVKSTPMHNTLIRTSASGIETRATYQAFPTYLISLKYEVLRAGAQYEKQLLEGFFNARHGSLDDFLFVDSKDSACVNQQFGVGDGITRTFRLTRSLVFNGLQEPVSAIYGTPIIKSDVVLQGASSYSINAFAGKITFNTPPAVGKLLTWTGNYYWRVRFNKDETEFKQFLWDLWECNKVELKTVKTI